MSKARRAITPHFSHKEILCILSDNYQLTGKLKNLPGYCDQNLLLISDNSSKYIIKVANSGEQPLELAMQNSAMEHLSKKELIVPHARLNTAQHCITLVTDQNKNEFCFRVLSYLNGNFYVDSKRDTHNNQLWHSLGAFMANISQGLSDFTHAGAYRYFEWDLAHGYGICHTKKHLLNQSQQKIVDYFLQLYQTQTMPVLPKCRQAVIHNDANDYNLLIDNIDYATAITGLIDFGDMVFSHVINELAITCAYALMEQSDPIATMCTIVAGYHLHYELTNTELEVLFSLVALRLCVSVCNSALAIKEQPNNDYLLVSVKPAWQLLTQLQQQNPYAVLCQLRNACGFSVNKRQS